MIEFIILFLAVFFIASFFILNMNVFGAEPKGERLQRMKNSKYYKDGKFYNINITPALAEGYTIPKVMFNFLFSKKPERIQPKTSLPSVKTIITRISPEENVYIWLGHSSYYLQINGVKLLIDPVFSEHGSPFPFGNKAFKGSNTYSVNDFDAIDYLVIIHDHFDHLDYPTIKKLRNKVKKVIVPLGIGSHFEKWKYKAEQLIEEEWYTKVELHNHLNITFTPARHFSGRKFKRNNTLWTSYVLESPDLKIFIGGDSGYDTHYKKIGQQYCNYREWPIQ